MSAIKDLIKDLRRHRVEVKLAGEKETRQLYLIELRAKTKPLEEFCEAFREKLSKLHQKLAKKIFGSKESENVYGVFLDEKLKVVSAFNRLFADYDRENKKVIYKDPNSIIEKGLSELLRKESFSLVKKEKIVKIPSSDSGGGMTFKYSMPDMPEPPKIVPAVFPHTRLPFEPFHRGPRGLIKYSLTEKPRKRKL